MTEKSTTDAVIDAALGWRARAAQGDDPRLWADAQDFALIEAVDELLAERATAVQNLLDDAARAFADADTSSERVEVIRDLLEGWYAAWPASAVTDEHEGIAHQIVALVYAAEARASDLPAWVLKLVRGLDRYELEHPTLYRQNGDGTYGRWPCPEPLLALVPAGVRRQAERVDQAEIMGAA